MRGIGKERVTLERQVEPNVKGFAHCKDFFLRQIGGSVEDRLVSVLTGEAERPRKRE